MAHARTGSYDARLADVWSAGVALYCLFNDAALPFSACKDINELRRRVTSSTPPPPAHASARAAELAASLMAKLPNLRPSLWKQR